MYPIITSNLALASELTSQWSIVFAMDGYLSSYSHRIDDFVYQHTHKPCVGYLTPTLSQPVLDVINITANTSLTCFYIGINWDVNAPAYKSNRQKVRQLVQRLDRQNLVNIYGPETGEGNMKPWAGYKGYRGSLPMDGVSVIYAIRASGLCLVLSTDPHLEDGLVSMRMFEGLAAGVPLICDRNPFIQRFFGDNVFYVDTGSDFALTQPATTSVDINSAGIALTHPVVADTVLTGPFQGLGQGQGQGLGQGLKRGLGQEREDEEGQRLDPVEQILDHIAYIRDHPEVGTRCNLPLSLSPSHPPFLSLTHSLTLPHPPPSLSLSPSPSSLPPSLPPSPLPPSFPPPSLCS